MQQSSFRDARRRRKAIFAAKVDTILNAFVALFLLAIVVAGEIEPDPRDRPGFAQIIIELHGPLIHHQAFQTNRLRDSIGLDGIATMNTNMIHTALLHREPHFPQARVVTISLVDLKEPVQLVYTLQADGDQWLPLPHSADGATGSDAQSSAVVELRLSINPDEPALSDRPPEEGDARPDIWVYVSMSGSFVNPADASERRRAYLVAPNASGGDR